MTIICRYCNRPAQLVTGDRVYPHRPDLRQHKFWRCAPCGAWVGVHPGTDKPLGILATAELRRLKTLVHAALDPLWLKRPRRMKRGEAYAWLAKGLGITSDECHVGMFDEDRCRAALAFLSSSAATKGESS